MTDSWPASFGADVRSRRADLGLSQQDLADLAGVSVRFIRALEHGKDSVRADKLVALLEALGLELRAVMKQPSDGL